MHAQRSDSILKTLCIAALAMAGCGSPGMVAPTGPRLAPVTTAPATRASGLVGQAQTAASHEEMMASFAKRSNGPGGGWLAGATRDHIQHDHKDLAAKASQSAEARPAEPVDVASSDTADLNHDGFVTLDEILVMKRVLSEDKILERIGRFDGSYSLTSSQQQYLIDRGISKRVIEAMTRPAPIVVTPTPTN